MSGKLSAAKTMHLGRDAVRLSNGEAEAVICLQGGMVPVFSVARGKERINAHWIPPFRNGDGKPYSAAEHSAFWKAPLLYDLAGDFLCSPNFGGDCLVDGVPLPPHGWTANQAWRLNAFGLDEEAGAAFARLSLESPDQGLPLSWERTDVIFEGQSALFSSTTIRNKGDRALAINVARHATVGPGLLAEGCRLSACADRFATPPRGSEFSATGRLTEGVEFRSLGEAPLRSGGRVDLSLVPGMIGFTDLVAGSVPKDASLGWSCVANPRLGLAHLVLFPGPAAVGKDEIALGFNDLWMQYGGRRFTPWAETEGGEDRCFCLGSECGTGAFANGLGYSREHPSLLGSPTTVVIPARGERTLLYATALVGLEASGVASCGALAARLGDDGRLILEGGGSLRATNIDASFDALRGFARP
jgi:hypothetical protein